MLLATLCLALAVALGLAPGCTVATAFRGPGYDPRGGVLGAGAEREVVVQLTHAVLRSDRRAAFDRSTRAIADALPSQPGLIGFSLRRELFGDEVWTMSVWEDEAALDAFVRSTVHRAAVTSGTPALEASTFKLVRIPAAELPLGWRRALELLAPTPLELSRR